MLICVIPWMVYDDGIDYERESFDALTDGMDADYDDWSEGGGNLSDLMEQMGY